MQAIRTILPNKQSGWRKPMRQAVANFKDSWRCRQYSRSQIRLQKVESDLDRTRNISSAIEDAQDATVSSVPIPAREKALATAHIFGLFWLGHGLGVGVIFKVTDTLVTLPRFSALLLFAVVTGTVTLLGTFDNVLSRSRLFLNALQLFLEERETLLMQERAMLIRKIQKQNSLMVEGQSGD